MGAKQLVGAVRGDTLAIHTSEREMAAAQGEGVDLCACVGRIKAPTCIWTQDEFR